MLDLLGAEQIRICCYITFCNTDFPFSNTACDHAWEGARSCTGYLYLVRSCSSLEVSGGLRMIHQHVKPSAVYVLYYWLGLHWFRLQSADAVLPLPLFPVRLSFREVFDVTQKSKWSTGGWGSWTVHSFVQFNLILGIYRPFLNLCVI